MKRAYLVPHPPIILPEVGRGEELKISATIEAYEEIAREIGEIQPETIIISSPHAPYYQDAFYMADGVKAHGNLTAFGVSGVEESVLIDRDLCEEILKTGRDLPIYYSKTDGENLDHGSLIPLRFIKAEYTDFKIVRLGLSTLSPEAHYRLGMAVAEAADRLGRKCVYIASGDLSHVLKADGPYGYREAGPAFDGKIIDILKRAAFGELLEVSRLEADEAAQCGLGSLQIMAGYLDGEAVESKELSYEGPFGVGYAIFSIKSIGQDEDRHFLNRERVREGNDPYIELARATIDDYVHNGKLTKLPHDLPEEMVKSRAGCFVSLHKFGELRGCIGTIAPRRDNLAQEIIQNAISASTRDPRFMPVRESELGDLEISVDILGDPEPIDSLADLNPKIYGVIVTSGGRRGLLLPKLEGIDTPHDQVAIALEKVGIFPGEDFQMERFKVVRHEYKE